MPWGWVDISLSITSVGPSSFNLPDVPSPARRIYARNKQNRIHRGGSTLPILRRFLFVARQRKGLSPRGLFPFLLPSTLRPPSTTSVWPARNSSCARQGAALAK